MNVWDTFANKTQLSQKSLLNYYILHPSGDNSRSSMERGLSVYSDLILNGCCLVNLQCDAPYRGHPTKISYKLANQGPPL